MRLPFTEVEFLNLFARFNAAFWPVVLILWIASAVAAVFLARGRATARPMLLLLAVHWLWSGLAFHAWFFTRINPLAVVFASMFVVQGLLFVWAAGQKRLHVGWEPSLRQLTGLAFVALALAYPLLMVLSGRRLPAAPAFGVPCPTALFTIGVLLCSTTIVPRFLLFVPLAWSVVGGSAAIALGMPPDLLLLAGALVLLPLLLPDSIRRRIDHWYTGDADAARPMQGDVLAPAPAYEMTVTRVANARPEHVWPWLLQLGYRRGGLYSYDWLDRLFGTSMGQAPMRCFQHSNACNRATSSRSATAAASRCGPYVRTVRWCSVGSRTRHHGPGKSRWIRLTDPHAHHVAQPRGRAAHLGARVFIALLGPAASS